MRHVLITGAGGQLGRELVEAFDGFAGYEVSAFDHDALDVGDRDATLGAITTAAPDVVIHAGAWTAVDACEGDPTRAFRVNSLGTRWVVDGARRVGARVVYVSTDYVFDGAKPTPYLEWDEPAPRSVYGRSKLGGERELRPEDTVVRTSWVAGRYGANIVGTILRAAAQRPTLSFVDDQHGNPTIAQDLAHGIRDLVSRDLPGVFHVTNQGSVSWYELAREVLSCAGEDPDRVQPLSTAELQPPRPAPRPANSVLENFALREAGVPLLPDFRASLPRLVGYLATSR